MKKVLFILKRREDYNNSHKEGMQTGLYNSASYMNQMLLDNGIESTMSIVIDNNCIDREVTKYKPDFVIIEALWVVPSKFEVLKKLHPNVKWIIRLHSEIPFLANEGIAFNWVSEYSLIDNVIIGVNSPRCLETIRQYIKIRNNYNNDIVNEKIIYLPNYYPQEYIKKDFDKSKEYIDISCYGAVRPLKNHLIQAFAAIKFSKIVNKKLRFHINTGRIEQKGESVFNNLKSVFNNLDNAELVLDGWTPRYEFIELCKTMDMGMQCSFSETFNIVAADLISNGVPVVGSSEIPWISSLFSARPTSYRGLVISLLATYYLSKINVFINQFNLRSYTNQTKYIWINYFK